VKYGHIITHLFMDGGRILKSVKTSYAEYLGNERMGEIVREMMKQQHKAMFIALRDGKFDPAIVAGSEASQTTQANATASPLRSAGLTPAAAVASPATLRASTEVAAGGGAPRGPAKAAPARTTDRYAPAAAVAVSDERGDASTEATRKLPSELTLDIDALERAAAAASAASPTIRAASDLPPPPPSLFREKSSGKYKVAAAPPSKTQPPIPRVDPPEPGATSLPPSTGVADATGRAVDATSGAGSERRYAPTRPAAIFGQVRPQQGKSMFGEDLIGDKSLDEVILSYLAEDLDDEKK
jgi:hypothetical protein